MGRGRSRKRGGGGGGRRQNNVVLEVSADGGEREGEEQTGVNVTPNPPPPIAFDLSLVKQEVVEEDEETGFVSVQDIKEEPVERGSGARLVDMLVSYHGYDFIY